jgi:hypothetical protein
VLSGWVRSGAFQPLCRGGHASWQALGKIINNLVCGGPSVWSIVNGALLQSSAIATPGASAPPLSEPATEAVTGDPTWDDVALTARLHADGAGAMGLVFRYADNMNYYRFSWDRTLVFLPMPRMAGRRRLVKNIGGIFTLLWEDSGPYESGRDYVLTIVVSGDWLRGYLDGIPIFTVRDADIPAGRVGLYTYQQALARFAGVGVYPADAAQLVRPFISGFKDDAPALPPHRNFALRSKSTLLRKPDRMTPPILEQVRANGFHGVSLDSYLYRVKPGVRALVRRTAKITGCRRQSGGLNG